MKLRTGFPKCLEDLPLKISGSTRIKEEIPKRSPPPDHKTVLIYKNSKLLLVFIILLLISRNSTNFTRNSFTKPFFPWDLGTPKSLQKNDFFSGQSETWVPKRGGLKPAGKRHFPATRLFRCCSAVFRLLHRSFWWKWRPHCRKANLAVQLLQRSIPKTAAQLPFSLVACCRGGV